MVRNAKDDFDHPMLSANDPLRPHVLYRLARADCTRLHNENSLAIRLTSECENRPETDDLVNGGDAAMLYQRCAEPLCSAKTSLQLRDGGVRHRSD